MNLGRGIVEMIRKARKPGSKTAQEEVPALLLGRLLSETMSRKPSIEALREVEFKIFSQFGDDGIIQWLLNKMDFPNQTFVEFGVSDYQEANTRFLLMNDNWSGYILDSSANNIEACKGSYYYWKHDLHARKAFINRDNINSLLQEAPFGVHVGILHIDLDGNDYWIWERIEAISPRVVILEYNAVFGSERSITIPYHPRFDRLSAHYSGLYFGASLPALVSLSNKKGYRYIGSNGAGNNAYFIRDDLSLDGLSERGEAPRFIDSKFRESRDRDGGLSLLRGAKRVEVIKGLPVYNVVSEHIEVL